ncbi:MAG TPA: FAD:protein FMN transferase [Acidimicrobiales bacterium]
MTTLPTISFPALGTTATIVVTDEAARDAAVAVLQAELDAIDRAASRFRPDSEITALNAAGGRARPASALFLDAVEAGLRAARLTDGLVDPTVGRALQLIGYDRDFAAIEATGPAVQFALQPVPGWQAVRVDRHDATVRIPAGVELDLGATAKALCADRAVAAAAVVTGAGILVSLGGDIAVAGPAPEGGWIVRVAHHHADPPETGGPAVSVVTGGLATSSTSARRWQRGGQVMHHIVDPATGLPAVEHWRTVTVAAASCLDANTASCAAIILGPAAPRWLQELNLPARLVNPAGEVVTVAGWPAEVGGSAEAGSEPGVPAAPCW